MKFSSIAALLLCVLLLGSAAHAVEVETVLVTPVIEAVDSNHSPVAENLTLETYRGVSVGGDFRAVDPDGDILTFRLVLKPMKGEVTMDGGSFVYVPGEGKRGRDVFTYVAMDEAGGVSAEAQVTVQIRKQDSRLCYADLSGSPLNYAAVRLAEEGVFTGEQLGTAYCFCPEATLTRGEFLAMCAALTDMQPLPDVTRTGFSDDSGILGWQKPYVSAALLYGVVHGSRDDSGTVVFRGGDAITRAEAAVMLNNFLQITDMPALSCGDLPGWAAQAVMNLDACDICSAGDFRADASLTRGEAAVMLSGAMDVLESRGRNAALRWAP